MAELVYPTTLPERFFAGDNLLLEVTGDIYSATEWTCNITLSSSTTKYTASASAYGSDYRFDIGTAVTALWTAATYQYQIYYTKTGYRVTHSSGTITVLSNIVSAAADVRTFPRKIADALEAAILNRATSEHLTLISQSCQDLNVTYKADVYQEWVKWDARAKEIEAQANTSANMIKPRSIYTVFT